MTRRSGGHRFEHPAGCMPLMLNRLKFLSSQTNVGVRAGGRGCTALQAWASVDRRVGRAGKCAGGRLNPCGARSHYAVGQLWISCTMLPRTTRIGEEGF